jgi:hypothetical protein
MNKSAHSEQFMELVQLRFIGNKAISTVPVGCATLAAVELKEQQFAPPPGWPHSSMDFPNQAFLYA